MLVVALERSRRPACRSAELAAVVALQAGERCRTWVPSSECSSLSRCPGSRVGVRRRPDRSAPGRRWSSVHALELGRRCACRSLPSELLVRAVQHLVCRRHHHHRREVGAVDPQDAEPSHGRSSPARPCRAPHAPGSRSANWDLSSTLASTDATMARAARASSSPTAHAVRRVVPGAPPRTSSRSSSRGRLGEPAAGREPRGRPACS